MTITCWGAGVSMTIDTTDHTFANARKTIGEKLAQLTNELDPVTQQSTFKKWYDDTENLKNYKNPKNINKIIELMVIMAWSLVLPMQESHYKKPPKTLATTNINFDDTEDSSTFSPKCFEQTIKELYKKILQKKE